MTVQDGLCRTWSKTTNTGFLASRLTCVLGILSFNHVDDFASSFTNDSFEICTDVFPFKLDIGTLEYILFHEVQTIINCHSHVDLSRLVGKPTICIGENKGADQLRGNREADKRHCFRYSDSTIPLLLKSEISRF